MNSHLWILGVVEVGAALIGSDVAPGHQTVFVPACTRFMASFTKAFTRLEAAAGMLLWTPLPLTHTVGWPRRLGAVGVAALEDTAVIVTATATESPNRIANLLFFMSPLPAVVGDPPDGLRNVRGPSLCPTRTIDPPSDSSPVASSCSSH